MDDSSTATFQFKPIYFRAPSNTDDMFCRFCGHAIRPNEAIADNESGDNVEYAHEDCLESAIEDQMEDLR